MKRRLFSAGMLIAAGLSTSLSACAHSVRPPTYGNRIGALMQFSVVDRDSGRELPIYNHAGEYWVAGTPGKRYAIRSRNATGARVMAVMSVDGVNVVSGETASHGQTGYVFGGGDSSDIAGWRKTDAQIAAFEFATLENSYAARTGRPDNVGVIGMALFRERVVAPPPPPYSPPVSSAAPRSESFDRERSADASGGEVQRKSEAPAGAAPARDGLSANESRADKRADSRLAAPAPMQTPSLGTAHGRREDSYVGRTAFQRARSTPDEVIRIRYDSRENLVASGVITVPPPRWPQPGMPSPFPQSEANAGFVPDPPSRY